jgi:AcrR family transcriptional regulator
MPIQVDVDQRRADVAEATFRVAARDGLRAVTLRSVAAALGASTTVITNYLPSRADLLLNAIDQIGEEWLAELRQITATSHGETALRRVMLDAVTWDDQERLRNHFWVAVLAAPVRTAEIDERLAAGSEAVRAILEGLLTECGHRDPASAADVLFLVAQGVFVSVVEAEDDWPPERARRTAAAAVDAVLAPPS